jgi:hypothetical protein
MSKSKATTKPIPESGFQFNGTVYKYGKPQYRDYLAFIQEVEPMIRGMFDGSIVDIKSDQLITKLGDSLPKLALIVLNAADPHPKDFTLDELLDTATPFSLLNIVVGFVVHSKMLEDFASLIKSVSELMTSNAA